LNTVLLLHPTPRRLAHLLPERTNFKQARGRLRKFFRLVGQKDFRSRCKIEALRGTHLLLQTRSKVLNNELEAAFRRWYPLLRVEAKAA
ncbi:MAG: hypothetical protein ACRD22_21160, partial [Terriglobia bacterium]